MAPHLRAAGLSCCVLVAAAVGAANAASTEPVVRVTTDEKANAAHIRASIDIAAAPSVVWAVITNCARMPRILPNVESCRIVKHDGAGRWDVREHVFNWAALMPKLRTVVRNTYDDGRRLLFKRVSGDMRISEGEWRLEPVANARATRLHYNALFAPDFPVPQFMIEQAVQQDMPNLLRAIRKASLEDARKQ